MWRTRTQIPQFTRNPAAVVETAKAKAEAEEPQAPSIFTEIFILPESALCRRATNDSFISRTTQRATTTTAPRPKTCPLLLKYSASNFTFARCVAAHLHRECRYIYAAATAMPTSSHNTRTQTLTHSVSRSSNSRCCCCHHHHHRHLRVASHIRQATAWCRPPSPSTWLERRSFAERSQRTSKQTNSL